MSSLDAKQCAKCCELLSLDNFYKRKDGRYRTECKKCIKDRNEKYYQQNKEKIKHINKKWTKNNKKRIRDTKLRAKFGITLEEKEQLFEAQDQSCAICKSKKNNKNRDWDVDHCHNTGVVRGILCSNCNRGLGLFQDSPECLFNAYIYLNDWKQKGKIF
jgi:hypothetical protein